MKATKKVKARVKILLIKPPFAVTLVKKCFSIPPSPVLGSPNKYSSIGVTKLVYRPLAIVVSFFLI